mmetsp:Transcript_132311/g.411283  ORF Transcript_132311/g.411283 Transcript_132311/m.411283 type:complete len:357 (+) Transcript_132311:43-1113(+)
MAGVVRLGSWLAALLRILAGVAPGFASEQHCQLLGLMATTSSPGVCMPAAGLGTGDVADFTESSCGWFCNLTQRFYSIGGRRTDSSDSYGVEVGLGIAMQRSGLKREDLFITSKVGPPNWNFPMGYNSTLRQVDEILRNYSTTYVDLLLVHQPFPFAPALAGWPTSDAVCDLDSKSYNEVQCRLLTWRAMLEIWRAGKARAVGVSNFGVEHLRQIADAGLPLPALNQVPLSPCQPQRELRKFCSAHGIRVQAYSAFGGNVKGGSLLKHPKIQEIAQAHDIDTAQVILNWMWRNNITSNPGFKPCPLFSKQPCKMAPQPPLKYMEANLHFIDGIALTDGDMRTMDSLGDEPGVPLVV